MELTKVISAPLLTEKTNSQMSNGVYTFIADYHANKHQIKQAVETIFQVKVVSVNTIKVEKQPKNIGRFHGFTNRYKKAIVKVAEGQVINLFPGEEQQVEEVKAKASSKETKAKVAEKERKLAAKFNKKATATKTNKTSSVKKSTSSRKVGGE